MITFNTSLALLVDDGFDLKNPKDWLDAIVAVLNLIFGPVVPPYVLRCLGWVLLGLITLAIIWVILLLASKIKTLWAEQFWPLFYDSDKKRKSELRRRFGDHIWSEIIRLNNLEQWSNYRFAELEAEVEAEGRGKVPLLPFISRSSGSIRRERSLSKALQSSKERLILLEGDPGSGKSVALKHVAQSMARRAMNARSTESVVPLYINLKGLERTPDQNIDSKLIRAYVLHSLNRVNSRDVEEFLDTEFDIGLKEATWLFLFDSFDELPEVLSSVEADIAIRSYADAIADFLHGMNQCRGIVASRHFRGPSRLGWPRFRILALTEERRSELIKRAAMKKQSERELVERLAVAPDDIRLMASNPMFLGLLVEHVKSGKPFPDNSHAVFERYVESRLTRDADRVRRRFGIDPGHLREMAEHVAFCISAESDLGLAPRGDQLRACLIRFALEVPADFDSRLDALEFIKLARSEAMIPGAARAFTFSHRRFQEYFATCVLLREPSRVSARQLLTDGRWREPAVVLCQTRDLGTLAPILQAARTLLAEMNTKASSSGQILSSTRAIGKAAEEDQGRVPIPQPFPWPSGCTHLLGILRDGFSGRIHELPDDIRSGAGQMIRTSFETGTLLDKKWGLEVSGSSPAEIFISLLRQAFKSNSEMLRDIAFQQVARAGRIPPDIGDWIRKTIIRMGFEGRLPKERISVHAHLSRLETPADFMNAERLMFWAPYIDLLLCMLTPLLLLGLLVKNPAHLRRLNMPLVGLVAFTLLWIAYPTCLGCSPLSGPLRAIAELPFKLIDSLESVVMMRFMLWSFLLYHSFEPKWGAFAHANFIRVHAAALFVRLGALCGVLCRTW